MVPQSFWFGLVGLLLLAGSLVSVVYGQEVPATTPRPPRADTSGSADPPAEPEVTTAVELDDEDVVVDEGWGEIEDIENVHRVCTLAIATSAIRSQKVTSAAKTNNGLKTSCVWIWSATC